MFTFQRPSSRALERFLSASSGLALSYSPVGIATQPSAGFRIDEASAVVGYGEAAFERARAALVAWEHFKLGWVELFPALAPVVSGTTVAVLIRHLRILVPQRMSRDLHA